MVKKKLMETGILLTKIDIAHFKLVNLEILIITYIMTQLPVSAKKVLWLLASFR